LSYKLHISIADIESLVKHADLGFPRESVALLFGTIDRFDYTVSTVHCISNEADSRTTFSVNPEEQYILMMEAESLGLELVGIFHSHPASMYPSSTDMKNMRLNPVVWMIASKESAYWEYAAYLLLDENLIAVQISEK